MNEQSTREDKFFKIVNLVHLFFFVTGLLLFTINFPELISGFGMAWAILAIFSHFKIKEVYTEKEEVIKSGTDLSLLILLVVAVITLVVNFKLQKSAFYTGCALGTSLGAGMVYCLILIKRFYDQI